MPCYGFGPGWSVKRDKEHRAPKNGPAVRARKNHRYKR